MKILKEIGLVILGALVTYIVITGVSLNKRVKTLEMSVTQIVQFLNQGTQAQQKTKIRE